VFQGQRTYLGRSVWTIWAAQAISSRQQTGVLNTRDVNKTTLIPKKKKDVGCFGKMSCQKAVPAGAPTETGRMKFRVSRKHTGERAMNKTKLIRKKYAAAKAEPNDFDHRKKEKIEKKKKP